MKIFLNEKKSSYIDSNAIIFVDLIKLAEKYIKSPLNEEEKETCIYKNIEKEFNSFINSLNL